MKEVNGYTILYKGMSESDRTQLAEDLKKALTRGTDQIKGFLTQEVEKAVTALYGQLIANPWTEVVRENSNNYEFMTSLREQIWEAMLGSDPTRVSSFDMCKLVEAWSKKYPDDWKRIVDAELAERCKKLEQQNDLLSRVNEARLHSSF
jgi:hypothetical protein